MRVYKGTIRGIEASWMSGGMTMVMQHGRTGPITAVFCDNAPTVRALDDCFGNVITPPHCIDSKAVVGKKLVYCLDAFGVLEWFVPLKDWELSKRIPPEGRDFKELDPQPETPKGEQLSLEPGGAQ